MHSDVDTTKIQNTKEPCVHSKDQYYNNIILKIANL